MRQIRQILALLALISSILGQASGQDSIRVALGSVFKDGIYLNYDQFRLNRPAYLWGELQFRWATNPQTLMTQVEYEPNAAGPRVPLDSIWGICIAGRPAIRLARDSVRKPLTTFAGLRTLGKICTFSYETIVDEMVEITAYNPATGKPFRKGKVKRSSTVIRQRMFRFAEGAITELNKDNLEAWMEEETDLRRALSTLAPDDPEMAAKLTRAVEAYNRRYPVQTLK